MQDRPMGAARLAFFFVGCFLGAGYLSGREIWEFFGDRGIAGFLCILPSVAILLITGFLILFLAEKTGKRSAEELVIPFPTPLVKTVFTLIQTLFLINIAVIMTSGAGALIHQLFGIPGIIGGLCFCFITVICSVTGVRGVVRVFSSTIPVLTVFVLILTVITCRNTGHMLTVPQSKNITVGSLALSSVLYAAYNLFGSVPIISSVGRYIRSKRAKVSGLALGAVILIIIAVCVFICQVEIPLSVTEELPLLAVAQSYGTVWGILFGVLLLCAMFGTALSTVVAANDMASLKWPVVSKHPYLMAGTEFLLLLLGGRLGFSDLISIVYPIFGYAGIALIVLLTVHSFIVLKQHKS